MLTLRFQQRFEDLSDTRFAFVGVVLLIFSFVVNMLTGVIAAAVAMLLFFGFWILQARRFRGPDNDQTRLLAHAGFRCRVERQPATSGAHAHT